MKKLLLVALFSLLGCTKAVEEVQTIEYVKDSRTNLCFVVSRINSYPIGIDYVYSNVPCSAEVEKLATVK